MLRFFIMGLVFFLACLQFERAQAQCYITFNRNCGAEAFMNECDGACDAEHLLGECGFFVQGNPNLNYSDIKLSDEINRSDMFEELPHRRFCGVVKSCICGVGNDDDYKCTESHGGQGVDYTVTERQTVGTDCDDRPPPMDIPLWP